MQIADAASANGFASGSKVTEISNLFGGGFPTPVFASSMIFSTSRRIDATPVGGSTPSFPPVFDLC
jgi:hypothetical protein